MTMSQVYETHKLIKSLLYPEALRVLNYLGLLYKEKKDYLHCVQTKPMIFLCVHMRPMEL